MTEKETYDENNEPTKPEEVVTDAELNRFNEWAAMPAEAAQRIVDLNSTADTKDRGEDLIINDYIPPEKIDVYANRRTKVKRAAGVAAASFATAGAVTAAVAGFHSLDAGADQSDRGEHSTSIESITLNEDARVRKEPNTGNPDFPNLITELDQPLAIDTTEGVRVLENTSNGTWYGIEASQIPDLGDIHDKDGIVWVNEQGVSSVDHADTTEEQ